MTISLISLAGCAWWASRQPAPSLPTGTDSLLLLLLSLAAYAVSMSLRGFRWGVILRDAGIATSRGEPYALTLIGYMGNTVLPLRGGEALRVVLLKEDNRIGWLPAIGSIVPERVLDLLTLAVLLVVLALGGVVAIPGGSESALVAAGCVVLVVIAFLGYLRLRRAGRLQGLADRIRPLAHASRLLATGRGVGLGLVSLAIWCLDGTTFWLVAESLSLPIGPLEGIGLAVVATAFATIPAGPAYAGTFDAALIFSLEALAITGGAALSFIILVRFVIFVPVTAVGLGVLFLRYGGLSMLWRRTPPSERELAEASPSAVTEGDPA